MAIPKFNKPSDFSALISEDERRWRLVGVILYTVLAALGFVILQVIATGLINIIVLGNVQYDEDLILTLVVIPPSAIVAGILYVLYRRRRIPVRVFGVIFVIGIIGLVGLSDSPVELATGRSIVAWIFPIYLSSVLIASWATFPTVVVVLLLMWAMTPDFEGHVIDANIYSMVFVFFSAVISWLTTLSMEKAIEDARSEARKNLAILEGVIEGIAVVSKDLKVSVANPAARYLLGETLSAMPSPGTEQLKIDGREISFSWTDVVGVGWVAVIRDETRRREVERAKDALLATTGHELRTPIMAISGFAEMIIHFAAGDIGTNPSIREMATRIRANIERLRNMVEAILDHAAIEAGTIRVNLVACNPGLVLATVLESVKPLADEKNIILVGGGGGEALPEEVICDPDRLRQCLMNLVGNAIKFTEPGGRVQVAAVTAPERWGIEVRDTGPGIPPEQLPDIFEPFRRASDYDTRTHQGPGLGLSITKRLVERMGGVIDVESEPGQGSCFTIEFPR